MEVTAMAFGIVVVVVAPRSPGFVSVLLAFLFVFSFVAVGGVVAVVSLWGVVSISITLYGFTTEDFIFTRSSCKTLYCKLLVFLAHLQ